MNSEEFDDAGRDVIASESLRGGDIGGTAVVNNSSDSINKLLVGGLFATSSVDLIVAPGDGFLGSHAVPETVTGEEDELARRVNRLNFDIGEGSHSLVFGLHGAVALVFEISESAGKSKSSVDTAIFDEAIGVVDALAFLRVIGLMVLRKFHGNLTLPEDSARVTSVSAVDLGRGDNDTGGGAASVGLVITIVQLGYLLLACGGEHHLVHLKEDFLKGLVVLLRLEGGKLCQLRHHVLLHKKSNFLATMTVKNSKEADTTSKIFLSDVRILHRASPALHADGAES